MAEAKEELAKMLSEDELRESILLVYANKQVLPNAMTPAEVTDKMGLNDLRGRTVSRMLAMCSLCVCACVCVCVFVCGRLLTLCKFIVA